jgi:diguanylate cyclase (GGDEF)-like protein
MNIQSNFGKDLAKDAMNEHFKTIAYKIENNIQNINKLSNTIVNSNSSYFKDKTYEDLIKKQNYYLSIFTDLLTFTDNIYSVYIGFNENQFFEVIKLDIDKNLKNRYDTKDTDKWLLVKIDKNQNRILSIYDENLKLTSTKIEKTDYITTKRPWYTASLKAKNLTKTGPYNFTNIDSRGITYSLNLGNDNIFAIDVLISNYNKILDNKIIKKSLESFLFDEDFNTIASSKENFDFLSKIKTQLKSKDLSKTIQGIKEVEGKEYLYNITPIKTNYEKNEYLISYVLLEEMILSYKEKFRAFDKIMIGIFIFILPIIWYFTSIIVTPIFALVENSRKIQNREFDFTSTDSVVSEISLLSNTMDNMAKSIHDYQDTLERKVEQRTKELKEKNKELEHLSITDKLTNTFNRIKLDLTLDKELEEANTKNYNFGIIIIDIDYFKQVNDTYGHQVGDTTLVSFANILREHKRDKDILGRWGGEEFIIISADSKLDEIFNLAQKLRVKVEEYNFPTIGNKTSSFGVSTYKKGETIESLINRADEALYKAKENGRNRVESLEKVD